MLATRRGFVATLTAAFMLLAVPASAGGPNDGDRADAGAAYLATQQKPNGSIPAFSPIGSTADGVLAFIASGAASPSRKAALGYLRTQVQRGNVNTVGLVAKVVQAVAAAGKDPRSFGGQDLVRWLRSRIKDSGKIGAATVFDQSLAILAIEAAGTPMPYAQAAAAAAENARSDSRRFAGGGPFRPSGATLEEGRDEDNPNARSAHGEGSSSPP